MLHDLRSHRSRRLPGPARRRARGRAGPPSRTSRPTPAFATAAGRGGRPGEHRAVPGAPDGDGVRGARLGETGDARGHLVLRPPPGRPRVEIGNTYYGRRFWGGETNPHVKMLMRTHAFGTWGCGQVALRCAAADTRSASAIERLGARSEGVLRAHRRRHDGTVADTAYFSILRAEWPGVRRGLLARRNRTDRRTSGPSRRKTTRTPALILAAVVLTGCGTQTRSGSGSEATSDLPEDAVLFSECRADDPPSTVGTSSRRPTSTATAR